MSHKQTKKNSSEKTREFQHIEAHVADKDTYQTACSVIHTNKLTPCQNNFEQ